MYINQWLMRWLMVLVEKFSVSKSFFFEKFKKPHSLKLSYKRGQKTINLIFAHTYLLYNLWIKTLQNRFVHRYVRTQKVFVPFISWRSQLPHATLVDGVSKRFCEFFWCVLMSPPVFGPHCQLRLKLVNHFSTICLNRAESE